MEVKNNRKVHGAIVWHRNELKMVTNQKVGKNRICLNNLTDVSKNTVKLAKIGDSVKYKDLSILPERCADKKDMRITYFLHNGGVGTDKDLYPKSDSSNYSHFVRGEN